MLTKILIQKIKNLLNWLINKFRKVNSNSVQFKLQQMEKERDMPGMTKKGKGKSAKMKKQAATAIAMKKAGKKPKKRMKY
tara:strand:- start:335 stop:574 length:240 start_codon:yes stop_codon:yes gene_type:complete